LPAVALAALGLIGCHAAAAPDPAALFQSINAAYLHGDLDTAETRAAAARREISAAAADMRAAWELKFQLLDAEILLKLNHPREVLALLAGQNEAFPAAGDLAIKRLWLCGLAHFRLGQQDKSGEELREARRLAESGQSMLIGEVLRAEGLVLRDSGSLSAAMEKFRGSLAVARRNADPLLQAVDLVDLGFVSLQSGLYDQSVVLSQEAANYAKSIGARRQNQIASGNLGWAYESLGDFDNALANFQAAEQQAKEIGMVGSQVLWLQDAGVAEYRLGNLDEARRYDEQALRLALTLPAADVVDQVVNIETNLALLLYDKAQFDAAKTYSDSAVLAAQGSKDNNVIAYAMFFQGVIAGRQAGDKDAAGGKDDARDKDAAGVLLSARQLASDPEIRMEIENALARLDASRGLPDEAMQWYRRSIQSFEENRSSVQSTALRLASFAYGDAIYRDYAEFLIAAHRPMEALQLLDRSRARSLEEGLGVSGPATDARSGKAMDPQAIARKLDAPILFYSLGPTKSYLWVVTSREARLFPLPGEAQIKSLVNEYQRAIQKSIDPLQTASPAAIALYDALIRPAAALIAGSARIFVIPDGVLHSFNFETLLMPATQGFKYWIEDVAVTTGTSIRILSLSRPGSENAAIKDLLLIGNPVSAGSEFEALTNASAEMQRVRQHFPPEGQTVLEQNLAVPAAYAASDPGQFRYIHFVAHGTASRQSPLDSAVILSPPPADPEDFKLYARDIVRHPLHARLVTISACYGSGLRTYAGEGTVGLAWAFLRAGSHNVIGALWQADDASTPLLMDRLYGELAAGKAPDMALRAAKLSLIHSSGVYRKPFYWAVFQLYAGS
jgi:CHAT domain-containing protein